VAGTEWTMDELAADIVTAANPVLDAKRLDAPLLDSPGAGVFRQAAVRLAREQPQTDGATEAARDAAKALLHLAAIKDDAALRQFLRPDPQELETTWTVACYQIGDLTPCALLDFASPVAAVASLASCGEPSHVAAELVASTPEGTRWTALTRTGRSVRFQLPDHRSASVTTGEVLGELSLAAEHWRAQLLQWAANPSDAARPGDASGAATPAPVAPPEVARRVTSPPQTAGAGDLEQALELVVSALTSLEAKTRASDGPSAEVGEYLEALDQRMNQFQTAVESALDRRIQALASYAAELARSFAAQQGVTLARLEARIDELVARQPEVAPEVETAEVPDPGGPPA
jgi:hypothetical protein